MPSLQAREQSGFEQYTDNYTSSSAYHKIPLPLKPPPQYISSQRRAIDIIHTTTQETAKTQFIEANGISFGYRVVGEAHTTEPPVLLLNHFRSSIDLWDPIIVNGIAASGRQVIPYDWARARARSNPRSRSSAPMPSLFSPLSFQHSTARPHQVDILSFSMGGYVVNRQVVLDSRDLIHKLIISGSGPSGSTGTVAALFNRPMPEVQSAIKTNPPQAQPVLDSFFPTFIDTQGRL